MSAAIRAAAVLIFFLLQPHAFAQDNLYARFTTRESKKRIHDNLVNRTIHSNLSLPLSAESESNWEDAFGAMEVLLLRNDWIDRKTDTAIALMSSLSKGFQRSALELAYTLYPVEYVDRIAVLMEQTTDAKIFAMCAEYLLQHTTDSMVSAVEESLVKKFSDSEDPVISMLAGRIQSIKFPPVALKDDENFTDLLSKQFLPGEIIMYSFQRKNRDYPGLVVIRNGDGNFVREEDGAFFNVPQLARSISNLPFYLTNGNTPQGLFRLQGFDVSTSVFIGPSPNIQMSMPGESSPRKFFADSSITDTAWNKELYARLLPARCKNNRALYQSYYAGLAGRTEIISHGTTIDPDYYKGKPYYPHTPTQGCLCTREIWDGKRIGSNQKKLVEGMLKAGGARGYCLVIELDDRQAPVSLAELKPALLKAESPK